MSEAGFCVSAGGPFRPCKLEGVVSRHLKRTGAGAGATFKVDRRLAFIQVGDVAAQRQAFKASVGHARIGHVVGLDVARQVTRFDAGSAGAFAPGAQI